LNEYVEPNSSEPFPAPLPEPPQIDCAGWSARRVLCWAYRQYEDEIAIASAFGAEGIVLIDMAAQVRPHPRVFVLDTSFLFPETYRLIEQVESRYGITVQRVLPALSPEEQFRLYGDELWSRDPDLCCQLRKVEPLQRQLAQLRAWVTSIRRDQTQGRAQTRKVAWDTRFGVMKINPLADWSSERVWRYIHRRKLPYNPLLVQNYPSIGCVQCTRPVKPGEDPRAGRWPGFAKTECGLHTPRPDAPLR
jgi:phosphoadenosine phosphosulfate reductase